MQIDYFDLQKQKIIFSLVSSISVIGLSGLIYFIILTIKERKGKK